MITTLFHSWEHRLASATKNRVVRPFEWGLEWLSLEAGEQVGGWAGQSPDDSGLADHGALIERWVTQDVMRDTHAFFTPPPTTRRSNSIPAAPPALSQALAHCGDNRKFAIEKRKLFSKSRAYTKALGMALWPTATPTR